MTTIILEGKSNLVHDNFSHFDFQRSVKAYVRV